MTVATIDRKLREEHIAYDLLRHEHTESATAEAAATGLSQDEVGKTVVLVGTHGFVRAVLPAATRLDCTSCRRWWAVGRRYGSPPRTSSGLPTRCSSSARVLPFSGHEGDTTVVDRRLALLETVVFEGGTHYESMRMRVRDLVRIANAQIADITIG